VRRQGGGVSRKRRDLGTYGRGDFKAPLGGFGGEKSGAIRQNL